jgi:hypothetical protein
MLEVSKREIIINFLKFILNLIILKIIKLSFKNSKQKS